MRATGCAPFNLILVLWVSLATIGRPQAGNSPTVRMFENIADALEAAAPWIRENNVLARSAEEVKRQFDLLSNQLVWSGDKGVLFLVSVELHPATGVTRIVGGSPTKLGCGVSIEDALIRAADEAHLRPSVSPGFIRDDEKAALVWVYRVGPQLKQSVVAQPWAGQEIARAQQKHADAAFMSQARALREDTVRLHALTELARRAENDEIRAQVIESRLTLESQLARAREIERKLAAALREAKDAEHIQNSLRQLRGVLSLAELAAFANARINAAYPPAKTQNRFTADGLEEQVHGYVEETNRAYETLKTGAAVEQENAREAWIPHRQRLMDKGAPPEVINDIERNLPVGVRWR